MSTRKIIHIDLDAFFCAVEELRNPELKGIAFAVGGQPDKRGVVSSCSYAARRYGVKSAMPMAKALRQCPELKILAPSFSAYSAASHHVMSIIDELTPLVEQVSIDEAFLDVSDLPESGECIAKTLQEKIHQQTGLPCSLGVASNKLVAKIATDTGKARNRGVGYPNAILVVPGGEEADFLAPLPVQALWGVGPKTTEQLAAMGIHTIGQLAALPSAVLMRRFGKYGRDLSEHAHGRDDSVVSPERIVKSISQETTFDVDTCDEMVLRRTLLLQCEQVGSRLRQEGLCGTTIRIKIRWPDFSTHTRQLSLGLPTDQDRMIIESAQTLFNSIWEPGQRVRLLGVGVSSLSPCVHQLSLWENTVEKDQKLLDAIDSIRSRFGEKGIRRGFTVKREQK